MPEMLDVPCVGDLHGFRVTVSGLVHGCNPYVSFHLQRHVLKIHLLIVRGAWYPLRWRSPRNSRELLVLVQYYHPNLYSLAWYASRIHVLIV